MLPIHFAVVRYEPPDKAAPADERLGDEELLNVVAALQKQLVRDVAPTWDVLGVVSPFLSLEAVPPDYIPIAITSITSKSLLPDGRPGFHFMLAGQPFALIKYTKHWSLAASHEIIEILCDPTGCKTLVGPSLADEKADNLAKPTEAAKRAKPPEADVIERPTGHGATGAAKPARYQTQGSVEYLVEVCDPCESSTYRIDGVLVSDFVTPAYYSDSSSDGGRYSFRGQLSAPRQVLQGGYLSWRSRIPDNALYQAYQVPTARAINTVLRKALDSKPQTPVAVNARLTIKQLGDTPAQFSRHWVDSHPWLKSQTTPFPFRDEPGQGKAYPRPAHGTAAWAQTFRNDVDKLIAFLTGSAPPLSIDACIQAVKALQADATITSDPAKWITRDPAKWEEFLVEHHFPKDSPPPKAKPDYNKALRYLETEKQLAALFGANLMDGEAALWSCMLTN